MKKDFKFKDEKSDKFWWINYSGKDFAVNYGKNGTVGKYEVKEFETIEDNDFELMFGDCGRIYYFIKKDELKKKNFDSSWLILQCY